MALVTSHQTDWPDVAEADDQLTLPAAYHMQHNIQIKELHIWLRTKKTKDERRAMKLKTQEGFYVLS